MTKNILVADDTADIRMLLERLLDFEVQDWDVTFAKSGVEALTTFDSGTFDFVVLDYMMPGMDGLSVAREVRARGYEGSIVVWSSAGVMIPVERVESLDVAVLDKFEIQKLLEHIRKSGAPIVRP